MASPLTDLVPDVPDETGEFPVALGSVGRPLFLGLNQPMAVRPVVVDSNALRADLLYALRTGRRTALLDASSGYGLRPFCPMSQSRLRSIFPNGCLDMQKKPRRVFCLSANTVRYFELSLFHRDHYTPTRRLASVVFKIETPMTFLLQSSR